MKSPASALMANRLSRQKNMSITGVLSTVEDDDFDVVRGGLADASACPERSAAAFVVESASL